MGKRNSCEELDVTLILYQSLLQKRENITHPVESMPGDLAVFAGSISQRQLTRNKDKTGIKAILIFEFQICKTDKLGRAVAI